MGYFLAEGFRKLMQCAFFFFKNLLIVLDEDISSILDQ